jgi:hypothetical protein
MGPRKASPGTRRQRCGDHTPSFCKSAAPRQRVASPRCGSSGRACDRRGQRLASKMRVQVGQNHRGCGARRAPRMVSHMPGQTRRTTSVAVPRHRSLRQAVPPAPMASPASRSTPRLDSFVQRVPQISFSKGACGDADVPQVPPLLCAGDRHVLLPQEESPLGAAELSVFEAVRARRLCGKHGVRPRAGCLAHSSHPTAYVRRRWRSLSSVPVMPHGSTPPGGHRRMWYDQAGFQGRPGRLRASRARRALRLSGAETIPWGRPLRPQAVATPEQPRVLLEDEGA